MHSSNWYEVYLYGGNVTQGLERGSHQLSQGITVTLRLGATSLATQCLWFICGLILQLVSESTCQRSVLSVKTYKILSVVEDELHSFGLTIRGGAGALTSDLQPLCHILSHVVTSTSSPGNGDGDLMSFFMSNGETKGDYPMDSLWQLIPPSRPTNHTSVADSHLIMLFVGQILSCISWT
jgi:hypothetical protein